MVQMNVHIKFIESSLGTAPNDKEIYSKFIGSKAPDAASLEEEIEAVGAAEVIEKGTTVFPRLPDGTPFIWDYQIKGFFKDACGALRRLTGKDEETGKKKKAVNESSKLAAYKSVIDTLIFPEPRKIPIKVNGEMGICQRPLRAETMQGPRTALASSEEVPAGSEVWFNVICMSEDHVKAVVEWLDYGYWRGFSQWRNSGKGRFVYEVLKKDGTPMFGNMELADSYMSA